MWVASTLISLYLFQSVWGQCPNNFVVHGDSCYHFSHDQETWADALIVCSTVLGGHLVEINSQNENDFIVNTMKASEVWIGLSDLVEEGVWQWQDSKTGLTYSHWYPSEPNNVGGMENCVVISHNSGWNDDTCTDVKNYVCEMEADSSVVIG